MKTEISFRTFKMMMSSVSEVCVVPVEHLGQVLSHGVILSFIIMGFWLLDSLKDPILENFLGMEYQPTAKVLSVLTTLFLVCIYDYLTSVLKKSELFHLISVTFGVIFMILSGLVSDPIVGLANRNKGPHRYVGWLFYFSIEAYGSLMVAMFWSYTNAVMDLEQAKGAYGLIIAIAQIGAIIGATLATHSNRFGIAQLILLGSMIILSVSLLIKSYHIVFKKSLRQSAVHEEAIQSVLILQPPKQPHQLQLQQEYIHTPVKTTYFYSTYLVMQRYGSIFYHFISSFYEGLILIWRYNYVIKLLLLSCLYEIVVTILDYEFKLRGAHSVAIQTSFTAAIAMNSNNDNNNENSDIYNTNDVSNGNGNSNNMNIINNNSTGSENQFANLMGHFGQLTNFLSLLISIFVFTFAVKKFGVKSTLMIFPMILFISVILLNLVSSLSLLFVLISLLKALIFSLNEPVKELLYIPTSDAIKFRAKAWIDVFGSRLAKAIGSILTNQAHGNIKALKMIAELPCIILSIGVIAVAWSIGTEFEYFIRQNHIVGVSADDDLKVTSNNNGTDNSISSNSGSKIFPPTTKQAKSSDDYLKLFDNIFTDDDGDNINSGDIEK